MFAKCEHQNPGGSIKDRVAKAIVDDAEARGVLTPGATLIEATAGNTGVGLALVCAVRGYRLVCVMPEKMSVEKRVALARLGAEVIVTRNAPPSDPENFQNVAKELARARGYFLTDQFNAPANVAAHEEGTGAEILNQVPGNIAAFVAGCGTGGTLTGVGRALRRAHAEVRVVLADPLGSRLAGLVETGELGPDGSYLVEGIGGSVAPNNLDLSLLCGAERVSDQESFAMVKRLVHEEGLLVGGSAAPTWSAPSSRCALSRVPGTVLRSRWRRSSHDG